MMRIEAARRVFPRCWFNETTTEAGRDALGYYHERRDENRNACDQNFRRKNSFGTLSIAGPSIISETSFERDRRR